MFQIAKHKLFVCKTVFEKFYAFIKVDTMKVYNLNL